MKTNLIIVTVLAIISLTSCSKSHNKSKTDDIQTTDVIISISQLDTRSETLPIESGTTPTFTKGYIYFGDATIITKVIEIVDEQTADPNKVSVADLTSDQGASVKNVPNSSSQVFIFSNLSASVVSSPFSEGASLQNVKDYTILLEQLYTQPADGSVTAVPLYGSNTINLNTEIPKVKVAIGAIASRLEIGKISLKPGAGIDSYNVAGIFINNYYKKQGIAGKAAEADKVNHGPVKENYVGNATAYQNYEFMYDWFETDYASNGNGEVAPPTGQVWGYNVFPAKNINTNDDNLPHIIIVLDKVKYEGNSSVEEGRRYLTLATFQKSNLTDLNEFTTSKIYKLGNIEFDGNDLELTPETKSTSTLVEIEIIPWTTEDIIWANNK